MKIGVSGASYGNESPSGAGMSKRIIETKQ